MPEAKKMISIIFRLSILLRIILRNLFVGDLSHVQYSSKDPCCSLACGHRRISGRRFSSPKWVERSDDRKYVCVRRLAVPKRHTFCSSSSSLATSITCKHFLRLVDTIPRVPRASLFQILLSSLFKSWYFSNFPSEIFVSKGREISIITHFPSFLSITTTSGLFRLFASPPSNLSHKFLQPLKTTASQQTLIRIVLRDARQLPCGDDASLSHFIFFFSCL